MRKKQRKEIPVELVVRGIAIEDEESGIDINLYPRRHDGGVWRQVEDPAADSLEDQELTYERTEQVEQMLAEEKHSLADKEWMSQPIRSRRGQPPAETVEKAQQRLRNQRSTIEGLIPSLAQDGEIRLLARAHQALALIKTQLPIEAAPVQNAPAQKPPEAARPSIIQVVKGPHSRSTDPDNRPS